MHPLAWWGWALGLAVATTRTTNPVVIALVLAAVVVVVLRHRDDTPWGRALPGYLVLGAVIVAVRVGFHVLVGAPTPGTVVLDLPVIPAPDWATGVQLLGPSTLEGLLGAAYQGLRLAALVICFGAANALANPKRALRSLPAALHPVGTALVIALSVTPALVTAAGDVRRARRLRGLETRGLRGVGEIALPVLTDALDRSLALAASMDSRGYARAVPGVSSGAVTALLVTALLAGVVGAYGLLDGTTPGWLGPILLATGAGLAGVGSVLASRRVTRTRYRPRPWRGADWFVLACGVLGGLVIVLVAATDPAALDPSLHPLRFPPLPLAAAAAALIAALPAARRSEP